MMRKKKTNYKEEMQSEQLMPQPKNIDMRECNLEHREEKGKAKRITSMPRSALLITFKTKYLETVIYVQWNSQQDI